MIPSERRGAPVPDRLRAVATGVALATTLVAGQAGADDTEVFFGQVDRADRVQPNVLFVIDTSGSMDWGVQDGYGNLQEGEQTRLDMLKSAMNEVLDTTAEVNVGLMRLNGGGGGGAVIYPMTPIDGDVCASGDCGAVNVVSQVGAQADNAEEKIGRNGSNTQTNGNILSMGHANNNSNAEQAVGLRFPDLDVPQGAVIESAFIDFTAKHSDSSTAALVLHVEDSSNADAFVHNSHDGVTDAIDRPLRSDVLPVTWSPAPWTADAAYTSPDITTLLQAAVDDADWCGGNALGLRISGASPAGGNGNRDAYTFRSSKRDAPPPTLRVRYTMQGATDSTGCQTFTTAALIQANGDDVAMENYGNGIMRPSWTGMAIPYNPRGWGRQGGLRFASVSVPKDADVIDARIQLEHRDNVSGGPVSFDIFQELSADAAPYSNQNCNLCPGVRTYASGIDWDNLAEGKAGELALTSNLAASVEAVVELDDWESGNAMQFRFLGTSNGTGYRTFRTRENDVSKSARLLITYQAGVAGGGNSIRIARDEMKSVIADLKADGGTPVVDALLEASNYYLGRPVQSGTSRGVGGNRHRYHRVSHEGSYTGLAPTRPSGCTEADLDAGDCRTEQIPGDPVYVGQLGQSCQANSIVLLTDGEPNSTVNKSGIESLIGEPCKDATGNGRCATDLASWLVGNDLNAAVPGEQKIRTHTVSFNLNNDANKDTVLRSIAEAGDGEMFKADDTDSLINAFRTILSSVQSIDTSFTAPGATVNQYNRLTHRDDIYFALFRPDDRPLWDGNLKKYKVGRGTARDDEGNLSGDIEIRGANGEPVVDPDSGFFSDEGQSYWTPEPNGGFAVDPIDGGSVGDGGAAAQMETPSERALYTYLGSGSDIDLNSSTDHAFSEDNDDITSDMLGLQAVPEENRADYRDRLLTWARGVDVDDADGDGDDTDGRRYIGDPMHSRPVILNYAKRAGQPEEAEGKSIIYLSTNEGFLHAIDTDDGEEVFGFIPKHLFGNLDDYYVNTASTQHPYGLDGMMSVWRDDKDSDYVVDADESAMVFLGMRRGGRNYYAFNVTDFDDPKLAWTIEGGVAGSDFEELGQSWSRATPARMRIGGKARDVLVIGGGYAPETQDPDYSDLTKRSQPTDTSGRALFIVDAKTGKKLWSVGHTDATNVNRTFSDMKYSMPADVRVVDVDLDGLVDQLYTADMGGQIWRFDVLGGESAGTGSDPLLQGGVMAKLNAGSDAGHRRFYNEPDVALIEKDGSRFMAVSIGSGWRAHPLDRIVQDRFYVIKSKFVRSRPAEDEYGVAGDDGDFGPITESDLVDVTSATGIPEANDNGWFLDFATTGEKVLGKSITFDDSVVFTTYVPDAASASRPCEPSIGGGRAYILSAVNGYPTRDISSRDNSTEFDVRDSGDGTIDTKDRSINLMHGGIAPEPAILITEEGTPLLLAGPEKIEAGFDNPTRRTFWADRGKGAVTGREPIEVAEDEDVN